MLKRMFLAIAFLAALGAGGLGLSSHAVARHHDCDDDYGYSYRSYYPAYYGYSYAPRVYYRSYPVYYRDYDYGHHHHHHDHDRSHVTFSFGF